MLRKKQISLWEKMSLIWRCFLSGGKISTVLLQTFPYVLHFKQNDVSKFVSKAEKLLWNNYV